MTISEYSQVSLNVLLVAGVVYGAFKSRVKKEEGEDKHDFLVSLDIKNLQQRLEDEAMTCPETRARKKFYDQLYKA